MEDRLEADTCHHFGSEVVLDYQINVGTKSPSPTAGTTVLKCIYHIYNTKLLLPPLTTTFFWPFPSHFKNLQVTGSASQVILESTAVLRSPIPPPYPLSHAAAPRRTWRFQALRKGLFRSGAQFRQVSHRMPGRNGAWLT